MEFLIRVNEQDQPLGKVEKLAAHQQGILHRAFSIFIFNEAGAVLLQQRALKKYHSGGLWSNACCSHPKPEENTESAAHRRLQEELGFDTELQKCFNFLYKAPMENGLIEHEYDHVFTGVISSETRITPNKNEVMNHRFISIPELQKEIAAAPEKFTAWLMLALPKLIQHLQQQPA